jgi:hypothetical protein
MSVQSRARSRNAFLAAVVAGVVLTAAPAFAQSGGIKGGFLYSTLKFEGTSDVYDSHNGWTVGIFFGGNKKKNVSVQGELNLLQKGGDSPTEDVRLYYLQVPVLLRVGAGGAVNVYGIVGPSFDIKVGESSPTESSAVQEWEGIDIGFMAGAGIEFGAFIVEGRGTWGLRNIASSVLAPFEGEKLTSATFALQAGFRFK